MSPTTTTASGPLAPPSSIGERLDIGADGSPGLTITGDRLLRRGVPHRILAGSLHYFRVHPALWYDRLQRLVDLGLNTVDTVVPWNFHQPREDEVPDFRGWRDIGAFLETAATVGLDVLLRPGPYVCAEWANGGLPTWLTARRPVLRSSDPRFLDPVARWFGELLPRMAPYQAAHGGPVVAVQVENEFGSYGDDAEYLHWIVARLRDHGITEMLYTADGPTELMLDGGTVDGVFAAANLGSKPGAARALLDVRRPGQPFFCAEFWNGWFDHWGHPHHVRDAANAAAALRELLTDDGSVSLYMAHGGTNFGLWAGANEVDGTLRPTITSYDSDAPIAEDGTLTEKFFALREVFTGRTRDEPTISAAPRFLTPRTLPVEAGLPLADVLTALARPAREDAAGAPTFEDLGFDGGLVRYHADVALPAGETTMRFEGVADRAVVHLDDQLVGIVTASGAVSVDGPTRTARLSVLVENLGRVNYGPHVGTPKGLTGAVLVERRLVQRWRAETIDIAGTGTAELAGLFADTSRPSGAGAARATLVVDELLDTHLRFPGFVKGFVWVNGFLLGRYWNSGPQQTLYVPAPLLRTGLNEIVVIDLEGRGGTVELSDRAELGPCEQYVEEF